MKIRQFRKCINRRRPYRYYPRYTRQIMGTGVGSGSCYWYGRMWWEQGRFELKDRKIIL